MHVIKSNQILAVDSLSHLQFPVPSKTLATRLQSADIVDHVLLLAASPITVSCGEKR